MDLVPPTLDSRRGRDVEECVFSPVPFQKRELETLTGPRDLHVKILQSEAEDVPF